MKKRSKPSTPPRSFVKRSPGRGSPPKKKEKTREEAIENELGDIDLPDWIEELTLPEQEVRRLLDQFPRLIETNLRPLLEATAVGQQEHIAALLSEGVVQKEAEMKVKLFTDTIISKFYQVACDAAGVSEDKERWVAARLAQTWTAFLNEPTALLKSGVTPKAVKLSKEEKEEVMSTRLVESQSKFAKDEQKDKLAEQVLEAKEAGETIEAAAKRLNYDGKIGRLDVWRCDCCDRMIYHIMGWASHRGSKICKAKRTTTQSPSKKEVPAENATSDPYMIDEPAPPAEDPEFDVHEMVKDLHAILEQDLVPLPLPRRHRMRGQMLMIFPTIIWRRRLQELWVGSRRRRRVMTQRLRTTRQK